MFASRRRDAIVLKQPVCRSATDSTLLQRMVSEERRCFGVRAAERSVDAALPPSNPPLATPPAQRDASPYRRWPWGKGGANRPGERFPAAPRLSGTLRPTDSPAGTLSRRDAGTLRKPIKWNPSPLRVSAPLREIFSLSHVRQSAEGCDRSQTACLSQRDRLHPSPTHGVRLELKHLRQRAFEIVE